MHPWRRQVEVMVAEREARADCSSVVDKIISGEIETAVFKDPRHHEKFCEARRELAKKRSDRHSIGDMLFPFDCTEMTE